MNVLVVGPGNIGTTLINVLLAFRDSLLIEEVFVLKNSFNTWTEVDLDLLRARGARICARSSAEGATHLSEVQNGIDYVFDCASAGVARSHKVEYQSLSRLRGACAQGSEKGFGTPFMSGVNPGAVAGARFVHIVSCNTHGTASVLQAVTGRRLENLVAGDFVVVRRSDDIGSHDRLVSASVVARHLNPQVGTHHAIDVVDLFKTIGVVPRIQSSDITTPSQLMHAARFSITVDNQLSRDEILGRIEDDPLIATTEKFDSNLVFELGRRYGFQGRIFEHCIIVTSNLLIVDNRIMGWAFVAQEGNTVLSTLESFLIQTEHPDRGQVLAELMSQLLVGRW